MTAAPLLPGLTASDPAFEAVWQVWCRVTHRRLHKQAAREEFYRQRRFRPGNDELVAVIEAQGKSERFKAGVIPDFRTWLHQRRWEDDPAEMTWNGRNGNGQSKEPAGLSKWELQVWRENQAMERMRHPTGQRANGEEGG